MTNRRSKSSPIPIILALVLLCGGVAAILWVVWSLPGQASRAFGPPSGKLSISQRLLYSYRLVTNQAELTQPVDPAGSARSFEIRLGESVGSIAARLADEGLIKDAETFQTYLIYAGLDTRLQAGRYELSPASSPLGLAQKLLDATPDEVTFGVLPGWRLEEIADTLPTSGLSISPQEFLAEAKNLQLVPSLVSQIPEGASLEGFLMPGEYRFKRTVSAGEVLLEMTDRFQSEMTPELRAGFEAQGLTLFQAVTLASLVQREAMVEEEQPVIASVFLNRLSAGMKLDSDPTAQYAIGWNQKQNAWWTNPLTQADLEVDSPYNTYIYPGLPPGPIANPSPAALKAVAEPANTPYFYFRARCDGTGLHNFSETYDEHVQNACP